MRKRSFRFPFTRVLQCFGTGTICSAAFALSSLSAADIAVNTTADSGAGSLRQGVSQANSGDKLVFAASLDQQTLVNTGALTISTPVSWQDPNPTGITLLDSHAITLGVPLTIDWTGKLILNGVISDSSTTATGSLLNTGTGTLLLSAANTYSGGTTISAGTIQLLTSTSLGTGALTVNGTGGTLNLGNGLTLANAVSLQSALTVDSALGTSNTLSGIISGSGGLKTTGAGTLILSGANTFTGGVSVLGTNTISLQNKSSLGTGTLSNTGAMTLNLADTLVVGNKISLGNNITVNVATVTTSTTTTGKGGTTTTTTTTPSTPPTATLSGAITGTGALTKLGDGTLILSGTNNYTGGTIVSQGTLQGTSTSLTGNITDNASLIFNQTTNGTFTGNLSGSGTLTKSGTGTLIYGGNSTLTGATTVSAGELQVTGTMSGPITVSGSTSTLSGTGTVGNVTNNGIVQPGTSTIGKLNVNGTYTQTSGTTEVKLDSAAGNTPGTNNDELNITGAAKLGGTLKVLGVGTGTYAVGTKYTILNAGSVSGTFSQALTDIANRRVSVTYDATDVTFVLQTSSSPKLAAMTSNQLGVGTALDEIALTSTGSLAAMISDLGVRSAAQQRAAMNQMSGEMYGNLQTLGLEIGDQFQQRITSALVSNGQFLIGEQAGPLSNSGVRGQSPAYSYDQAMPYGSSRGWLQGYGFGGNLRSDGNGAGMSFGQGGGIYAVELGEDETGRIGVVAGNTYGAFSDSFNGGGTINSYQLGMYTLKHDEFAYVLGSANYGYNQYYTHRTVSIGTVDPSLNADFADQSLKGDYEGSQIGAHVETGLKLSAGIFHIQPLVGLQYLYLCQQGFDESGGAAALTVARSRANSLRASIGARVLTSQLVGPRGSVWTPYSHVRLVSDLLDNDRLINASFSGATSGGAFTAHGTKIGQNYGVIGEGVEIRINESWSLFGGGELTFGDRIFVGTGSIGALTLW